MKVIKKGQELVITIPLEKPKPSKSGRTLLVCSSRGVRPLAVSVEGKTLYLVLNGFIYPEERVPVGNTKNRERSDEDDEE
jgi:hypothetical protein